MGLGQERVNLWIAYCNYKLSDFQKQYRGLCAQDLQEAKDLMLVETADMLRVI